MKLVLISILYLLCIVCVVSGWSCACGCCNNPVNSDGSCSGYIPFMGWILTNRAQCNGQYQHDILYCAKQCSLYYPSCPVQDTHGNCDDAENPNTLPASEKSAQHSDLLDVIRYSNSPVPVGYNDYACGCYCGKQNWDGLSFNSFVRPDWTPRSGLFGRPYCLSNSCDKFHCRLPVIILQLSTDSTNHGGNSYLNSVLVADLFAIDCNSHQLIQYYSLTSIGIIDPLGNRIIGYNATILTNSSTGIPANNLCYCISVIPTYWSFNDFDRVGVQSSFNPNYYAEQKVDLSGNMYNQNYYFDLIQASKIGFQLQAYFIVQGSTYRKVAAIVYLPAI